MNTPISSTPATVFVEYGEFFLFDTEGTNSLTDGAPSPWDLASITEQWMNAGINAVCISSNFATHSVDLVIEVWESQPRDNPSSGGDISEGQFTSTSGRITLSETTSTDEEYPEIELGSPDSEWNIRAVRTTLRTEDPEMLVGEFEGLESFVIQIWPVP